MVDQKADKVRPPTLAELEAQGKRVWIWCSDCFREKEVWPSAIGVEMRLTVPELKIRLRCSGCGSRKIDCKPQIHEIPLEEIRRKYRGE